MSRAAPPGNERAGRNGCTFRPRKKENGERSVTDKRAFRKCARIVQVRRCLEPDIWVWLEWTAASNTGGWLP
jgi:hypothetical protein